MEVKVIRAGMATTVQDLGRRGYRAAGVPLSGAMDPFALRIANLLVGNAENAAALEITLIGPELEFSADTIIALTGAECEGSRAWTPIMVRGGERLKIGECVTGCRAYLAIAGGIDVDSILGSRSTYLGGGFGGFQGRALREGDGLTIGAQGFAQPGSRICLQNGAANPQREKAANSGAWHIDPRIFPAYASTPTVRVLPGAQADEFGEELFTTEFKISPQSDRMGLRLTGEKLTRTSSEELLSSAVVPGTVQVPPDGQPLILMADAQTIGGYPQVAHVISVDRPLVAQLRPGEALRFAKVSLDEAQRLLFARERALGMLREGLAEKWVRVPAPGARSP